MNRTSVKYWLELKITKVVCILTIYTLKIYTKKQFKCNKQRHSNHSMAWGPLFKTNIYFYQNKVAYVSLHNVCCRGTSAILRKYINEIFLNDHEKCVHGGHEELMAQEEKIFHVQQLHEIATVERKWPCIANCIHKWGNINRTRQQKRVNS